MRIALSRKDADSIAEQDLRYDKNVKAYSAPERICQSVIAKELAIYFSVSYNTNRRFEVAPIATNFHMPRGMM